MVKGLEVRGLNSGVGTYAISAASFWAPQGGVTTVMGPSGSGKSTFLNAVAGFLPLSSGEIFLNGTRVDTLPPEKRRIAMVFQRSHLFPHLTVLENVMFGLNFQVGARADKIARARRWLQRLEIVEQEKRRSHELSEGQAQRAALARALVVEFPCVLLDEPFSALDTQTKEALRHTLMTSIQDQPTSIVLVTHDPSDAKFFGGKSYLMDSGNLTVA